ncbi:5'-3' exonuclease, partial [Gordonia sp. UCD-TK1]|uniref:5'-3' exonuclease n=1 Tax=Gordonia sp. UCD-TK1 TaxID=1857893 RepID=UPI00080E1649
MLLDGASLWFRSFFALPEKMTSPDGRPVNAVRGFVDTIANLVVRERPTRLVVCLDLDWRPEFRTDLIPTYKAHRVAVADGGTDVEGRDIDVEEVPDTLTPQVDMIMAVLAAAGIATSGAVGCEADDVIGTLAYDEANDPVIVVSGDRDLLQVVADDPVPVRVLYVGRGLAKAEMMGPVEVAEKYGVPVERAGIGYAEMSMLRGDPSDGLPGVAGVGEKTAAKLITEYGSLDALEAAAADPSSSVPT